MRRIKQLAAAQTVVLNGLEAETFVLSMDTSVSQVRVKNLSPGQLYVLILKQNHAGGHTIAYGASIRNAVAADPRPFAVTVQSFIADTGGILRSNLPGTWGG
jgi:ABC-type Zn uptake system ZnuABC Zn-binding protein ZnuA